MNTIKSNTKYEEIIKNSKFISLLFKVDSLDDINNYLEEVKVNYPKATHYCYAYIIDNIKKSSDDGEPSGTAGFPILHVLEENNLNHVLCIVVRYFGGIKLGAGGLLRAYTKSTTNALKMSEIISMKKGILIKISFTYNYSKDIDYLLKNEKIIDKKYNELIEYTLITSEDILNILKEKNIEISILDNSIYY